MLRRLPLQYRRYIEQGFRRQLQRHFSVNDDVLQNASLPHDNTQRSRFRSDPAEAKSNIRSIWANDFQEIEGNAEPGPFVPFFDEVDAHMNLPVRKAGETSTIETTKVLSLESLFDNIDDHVSIKSRSREGDNSNILLANPSVTGRRSILDAFPLPDAGKIRSATAFDEESFREYMEIVEAVRIDSEIVKEWLHRDDRLIDYYLPRLDHVVQSGESDPEDLVFRDELEKQRLRFLAAFPLSDMEYARAKKSLIIVAHRCAKTGSYRPIEIAWEKIKEAGMAVDSDVINTFMYVATTYGRSSVSDGSLSSLMDLFDSQHRGNKSNTSNAESELKSETVNLGEEMAAFHDSLYESSEQSLAVRVKAMVRKGNATAASNLLNQSGVKLKLRSFQPIFRFYLDQGELSPAFALFKCMRDTPSVVLESETYVQLIAAAIENGALLPNAPPIPGCADLGFDPPSGPELLDQLASMLAEDVLEITPGLAKLLHTATTTALRDTKYAGHLEELHPLAPLQRDVTSVGPDHVIASRVPIDVNTGKCAKSGAQLRLITLTNDERLRLKRGLLEVAKVSSDEYYKKLKRDISVGDPGQQLEIFSNWLDSRTGNPYTAIIDGANVAFYLQNFDDGKFNFYQIKFMVETLERMGETPLVIMPNYYTKDFFHTVKWNGRRNKQVMTIEERSILDDLYNAGKLYVTPRSSHDDYFWILASLSLQEESRAGRSLDVPPDDPSGRWPGVRPMLVSNDQMRDHKMNLIEPRLYRRWYSSHIVNFNFTGFVHSKCIDDEVGFCPADFFSREIQANATSGGITWHFPVKDWDDNERFCLRLPRE